ncbi:MAG TPA: DNA recombination/repair protein RecA, partial [Anaerolineales bacterium]|nr:DNA recombination/repair protein RecA [Anaerolineales bacterium]
QGRENTKRALRERPEIAAAIEAAIREQAFGSPLPVEKTEPA